MWVGFASEVQTGWKGKGEPEKLRHAGPAAQLWAFWCPSLELQGYFPLPVARSGSPITSSLGSAGGARRPHLAGTSQHPASARFGENHFLGLEMLLQWQEGGKAR